MNPATLLANPDAATAGFGFSVALSAMNPYAIAGVAVHHTTNDGTIPPGHLICAVQTQGLVNTWEGGPAIDMTVNHRLGTLHRTWMGVVHIGSATLLSVFLGFASFALYVKGAGIGRLND